MVLVLCDGDTAHSQPGSGTELNAVLSLIPSQKFTDLLIKINPRHVLYTSKNWREQHDGYR